MCSQQREDPGAGGGGIIYKPRRGSGRTQTRQHLSWDSPDRTVGK